MPAVKHKKQQIRKARRKPPPLALAEAIFQTVGFDDSRASYVLKEEALSAWGTLQAMEEKIIRNFPKYVIVGFFRKDSKNIRATMTFLRRIARYIGRVIAREKFHRRINGKLRTFYRYRLLRLAGL